MSHSSADPVCEHGKADREISSRSWSTSGPSRCCWSYWPAVLSAGGGRDRVPDRREPLPATAAGWATPSLHRWRPAAVRGARHPGGASHVARDRHECDAWHVALVAKQKTHGRQPGRPPINGEVRSL